MGKYHGSEYYDDAGKWMGKPWENREDLKSFYCPPWPERHWWAARFRYMRSHVDDEAPVLDIGCGNGIFAAYLYHTGHRAPYLGYDFSRGSVKQAIIGNKDLGGNPTAKFEVVDLRTVDMGESLGSLGDSSMVVCAETLEHLEDDHAILKKIPPGANVLITVPMFDADSHVRWFPDSKSVTDRYGEYFDAPVIERISTPWRAPEKQCYLISGEFR